MILQVLPAMLASWIQRHPRQVITYQQAENRVLTAKPSYRRLCLADLEGRRLAMLAHPLGLARLNNEVATMATSDAFMRWCKQLIAEKFDGSMQRHQFGGACVHGEIEHLLMCIAEEHSTWNYRRIRHLPANLGITSIQSQDRTSCTAATSILH